MVDCPFRLTTIGRGRSGKNKSSNFHILCALWLCALTLFCCDVGWAFASDQLSAAWTVTVNGKTAVVNSDGSFSIDNVSAADQFGAAGPGSQPDFISDDAYRLTGVSSENGVSQFVFSDPFRIASGQTFRIPALTFTSLPPPLPVSIVLTSDSPTLTAVGQTTQVHTIATLGDGSTQDVTPHTSWTTYRISNPAVATVNEDGLVTARSAGIVLITATNGGAAAVTRVTVSPGDPLTLVEGFVQKTDGMAVVGAQISLGGLPNTGVTDASGRFVLIGVPTLLVNPIVVTATRVDPDSVYSGQGSAPPVPGGITDVGIIVVRGAQAVFDADLGTKLPLNIDDGSVFRAFTGGFAFPYYGQVYTGAYIGSNGYVTFNSGDGDYTPTVAKAVNGAPRLSVMYTDLDGRFVVVPEGGVYLKVLADRAVITWYRMGEYGFGGQDNTAQIILFADGRIQYGYRGITTRGNTRSIAVALTPGGAPPFHQLDFTAENPYLGTTGQAMVELFGGAAHLVDLDMGFLQFTPNAVGGYDSRFIPPPPPIAVAEIRGQAVDRLGNPLPGVAVSASISTGEFATRETYADKSGFFRFEDVPISGMVRLVSLGGDFGELGGCARPLQARRVYVAELKPTPNAPKGSEEGTSGVADGAMGASLPLPPALALQGAYPNPTLGMTTVRFGVPRPGPVRLDVYDVRGRLVRTLQAGELTPGWYARDWDSRDNLGQKIGSGVYFLRLTTPDQSESRKLIVTQ